jgi:hypothetical protein
MISFSIEYLLGTCPTYALFLHVVDSKENLLRNVSVNVTEWTSGILIGNTWKTNNLASLSLNLTFGRYNVKVYNNSAELGNLVVLNETIVDLTEDNLFEIIHCRIANLSSSVLVVDYFGKPIPNAKVEVERFSELENKWVEITPCYTDSNGVASLPNIGGDYSISIDVSGQISAIKTAHIDEPTMLAFKIDKYVAVGGLIIETAQIAVYVALGLFIVSLGILLIYKKILQKNMPKK